MLDTVIYLISEIASNLRNNISFIFVLFPMIIVSELPLILTMVIGNFKWYLFNQIRDASHTPPISFIITCYGEGDAIAITIDTLVEQVYTGHIEILAVVDGATQNSHTYKAAVKAVAKHKGRFNRTVRVIPKWQRGGRVSTLNTGLYKATHDLVINVDGDTSFDNDMASNMASQFANPNTVACGGALRVRNHSTNILTRMQALEYMMSMQGGKTGTSQFGFLNNISGAFGAFRKPVLKRVGGWDTHTAEDLDLTMRFKQYKTRYPHLKLGFTPHAVGHTDAPDTIRDFVLQRLRWDGDLLFLYLRKHIKGLTPALLGWPVFIYTLVYGVLQNVLLPILISGYSVYLLFQYPIEFSLSLYFIVYVIYLALVTVKFFIYWVLISERKSADIKKIGWLILYPLYALFSRFITAFSMFNEVFRRSHEESSMAPWWVLKRGKRF